MAAMLGPGAPESTSTGTSTGGVRIPPSAIPSASRAIAEPASFSSSRGAKTGGMPMRSQVSSEAEVTTRRRAADW